MKCSILLAATVAASLPMLSFGSSHREAPNIAGSPRVDGTDLYLFRSYEAGRENYVTVLANYIPFQEPGGGPNFYQLDPNAVYAINIDNNGDGKAAISFQFRFRNVLKALAVPANGPSVAVPLLNIGPVTKAGTNLNVEESYTITVVRNGQESSGQLAGNGTSADTQFYKPTDNIGEKSITDYAMYASDFMFDLIIPGCSGRGRVFVGQRKEGFVVNVGEIFDLVNTNPVGPARWRTQFALQQERDLDRDGVADRVRHPWERPGHRSLDDCQCPEIHAHYGQHGHGGSRHHLRRQHGQRGRLADGERPMDEAGLASRQSIGE